MIIFIMHLVLKVTHHTDSCCMFEQDIFFLFHTVHILPWIFSSWSNTITRPTGSTSAIEQGYKGSTIPCKLYHLFHGNSGISFWSVNLFSHVGQCDVGTNCCGFWGLGIYHVESSFISYILRFTLWSYIIHVSDWTNSVFSRVVLCFQSSNWNVKKSLPVCME